MSRTTPSTARTLLAAGAFLALAAAGASMLALLHEPALVDAARGLARRMEYTPVSELRALACDPSSSDVQRLAGLIELRDRSWGGEDGRDAAVVAAMVEMACRTELPEVRADILRNLSGVTEPALLPYLVLCLERDASEEVRSEAAETLFDYLPDEIAAAALSAAATGDPSPLVRSEAERYLE